MDTQEEWRDVPEYEGLYRVSNLGRVFRVDKGYFVTLQAFKTGYIFVALYKHSKRKLFRIHRLLMAVFVGTPPPRHEVNHLDGDKTNNQLSNLEYVTRSQNIRHAIATLGHYHGVSHSLAKLNDEAVRFIRSSTLSKRELAEKFGVTTGTINCVIKGKTWKHVSSNEGCEG